MGFGTPTGKFEIYSTIMKDWGYDPLPLHVEPAESPISTPERYKDYPLLLIIGAKQPMYWHSQSRQLGSIRKHAPEPIMELHTMTAESLGVSAGQFAGVETIRGRLRMKVRFSILERFHTGQRSPGNLELLPIEFASAES